MHIRAILAPILLGVLAPVALAQSTAFTYQGKLNDAGQPANGLHDFRFKLFDAATGGTQLGATQCVDNLQVSTGTFNATIDFGNQFVSPNQRFLEIEVRRDTGLNCSNVGGFVLLAPRQLIAAAPIATHAKSAFTLDSANGGIANVVFVDNAGKVGIGTTTPTHSLHIATSGPTIALQDTNASSQQAGYVSYRDNTNVERAWIGFGTPGDPDFSIVNARPSGDIVLRPFFGNVGINTTSPAAALDVAGAGLFSGSLGVIGNIGVGTNAPTTRLDVRGNIRLGNSGELFAPGAQENLRIVRGTVDADGTIVNGQGFTVDHLGGGSYRVNFTVPFFGGPTVLTETRTGFLYDGKRLVSVSSSSFSLEISPDGGGLADGRFNFVAVGQR